MKKLWRNSSRKLRAIFTQSLPLAAQTDIVQLLLRTKGAKVFVPNNWEYDTFLVAFPGGSLVKHVVKNEGTD